MKVVGLISGGKDSIWNLHYCLQFGHELRCLANLAPPPGVSELDSYMYQTVGYDLIDSIVAALGVPLVRRVIAGKPRETASNAYTPQDGDEVEDLTLLLQDVLHAHPDVEAVSCGAILSNYQRLRVENVCARLGLKVLAFMWMQEQPLLLQQMIDSELDARIVKVASMGLSEKHVGESILNPTFAQYVFGLGSKWGVHVCGEGGEYESIVVDAPLYAGRVRIAASEKVPHPDGDEVVFLRVSEASTEAKDGGQQGPPFAALDAYSSLRYYQETFAQLVEPAAAAGQAVADAGGPPVVAVGRGLPEGARAPALRPAGWALASSSLDVLAFGLPAGGKPEEQCDALLQRISAWLQEAHGKTLQDAIFCEIQVGDLGAFVAINAVYARHFHTEPPPRVCIETPLPLDVHVRIRLLLRVSAPEAPQVESLRVQSISTWAMACIGPYSQAMRQGPVLLSAGVIGLVPHSMDLPTMAEAAGVLDAAEADGAESMCPWQAELWMLLRSLQSVLLEMGSGFGEVRLAQVYTANEDDLDAVAARVLAYMRREDAAAAPILAISKVPRLPKDGCVEINVVCARAEEGKAAPAPRLAREELGPEVPVPGALAVAFCALARTAVVEFEAAAGGAELPFEAVSYMAQRCVAAALRELDGLAAAGLALQVQFALASAHDAVAEAVHGALGEAGLLEACAVSYMPVLSMRPRTYLRLVALAGGH